MRRRLLVLLLIGMGLLPAAIFFAFLAEPTLPLLKAIRYQGKNMVRNVAFSPSGDAVAVTGDVITEVFNLRTWNRHDLFSKDTENAALFTPANNQLVTSTFLGEISIYDMDANWRSTTLQVNAGSYVHSLALSSNGRLLAVGNLSGSVPVFDLRRRELKTVIESTAKKALSVGFLNRDQTLVVGAIDGHLELYDILTGRQVKRIPGHVHGIGQIAISPDQALLVSLDVDGEAVVWKLPEFERLCAFTGTRVVRVAIMPQARLIVTAGMAVRLVRARGHVGFWDIDSGRSVATYYTPDKWLVDIGVSKDEKTLATAGADNDVRFWDISGISRHRNDGAPNGELNPIPK